MAERVQCEFSLIRYLPDVVKGEFANIGVVLREAGRADGGTVRFTRDWSRVRCLDPNADVELLESLEVEIAERMRAGVEARVNAKPVLALLQDTLSNSVQLTEMRGTLAESMPAEMEQLMRMYVEPLKVPAARRKTGGRTAIAGRMRDEFERAGVWGLMRKRIAASEYTRAGDPLKIDCGYRNDHFERAELAGPGADVPGGVAGERCGVGQGISVLGRGVARRREPGGRH